MRNRELPLVCSADELHVGDRIVSPPGVEGWPLVTVGYVACGDGIRVRVGFGDGQAVLLDPGRQVTVIPSPAHVAAHYEQQAAAAKGLHRSQREAKS